jgi:hypothetical protein
MFTTTDTAKFVTVRFAREDKAGIEAIAAGIVWGFHNPVEFNQVLDGKTPAGFKALRTEIEDKTTSAKARQWSTNVRKAASLLIKDKPDLTADALPDTMATSVDLIIEWLAPHGTNAFAIGKAYAKAFAPAPAAVEPVETAPAAGAGVLEEEPMVDARDTVGQVADILSDLMAHGLGGDAKQADIAQLVQFCIAKASDATLSKMATMVNDELIERMNAAELLDQKVA